jgi:glycyl-tRNA synthetase beta subunit
MLSTLSAIATHKPSFVQGIEKLSAYIADIIGANTKHSARAGLLSKTDLITDMVGEFK